MPFVRGRHRADSTLLGARFNLLWLGQSVSFLGDYMAYISVPLFVAFLAREGSSTELGISYALESAPALVIGLAGGILLDRLPLRRVMVVADLARAAAFLYLAWMAGAGLEQHSGQGIGVVFVVAFITGSFTSLFQNGLFTAIPQLVPHSRLVTANSRMVTSQNLAVTLGPALAGVIISRSGFAWVFVADAATFLISALSLGLIGPLPPRGEEGKRREWMSDIANGLRYIWNELRLRISTIALTVNNFVLGFIEATFVLAAARVVGATEGWQQGVLFATFGLGGVAGALAAPTVVRLAGLGRTLIAGMILFGLAYTIFVNTTFGIPGSVYLFAAFVGIQLVNVPVTTIRQAYTPSVLYGRVIAGSRAIAWASLPLGALIGTSVVDSIGNPAAFATATRVAPIVVLVVGIALLPTIIWRDTFGPGSGRGTEPHPARKEINI